MVDTQQPSRSSSSSKAVNTSHEACVEGPKMGFAASNVRSTRAQTKKASAQQVKLSSPNVRTQPSSPSVGMASVTGEIDGKRVESFGGGSHSSKGSLVLLSRRGLDTLTVAVEHQEPKLWSLQAEMEEMGNEVSPVEVSVINALRTLQAHPEMFHSLLKSPNVEAAVGFTLPKLNVENSSQLLAVNHVEEGLSDVPVSLEKGLEQGLGNGEEGGKKVVVVVDEESERLKQNKTWEKLACGSKENAWADLLKANPRAEMKLHFIDHGDKKGEGKVRIGKEDVSPVERGWKKSIVGYFLGRKLPYT